MDGETLLGERSHKKAGLPSLSPSRDHPRQHCLGLGEPEGHLHRTIQLDSRGQGCACLLALTDGGVQRAQPVMTVDYARAHAEFLGPGGTPQRRSVSPAQSPAGTVEHHALLYGSWGAYTRHRQADAHQPGTCNTQKIERKPLT